MSKTYSTGDHDFGFYKDAESIRQEPRTMQHAGAWGYARCSCGKWHSGLLTNHRDRVEAHRDHVAEVTKQ